MYHFTIIHKSNEAMHDDSFFDLNENYKSDQYRCFKVQFIFSHCARFLIKFRLFVVAFNYDAIY
jgi:hypothetical protein